MKEIISKLIYKLIIPCEKVTMMLEKDAVGQLSFIQRIRLRYHIKICKWCAIYAEKMMFIDQLLRKKYKKEDKNLNLQESEIQDINNKVKEKLGF